MRILLIKLLLRLLTEKVESEKVDKKRLDDWLEQLLMPKSGFQDWYTLRKKSIIQGLTLGYEGKEYWILIGRLLELKQLATTSESQLKKVLKKDRI